MNKKIMTPVLVLALMAGGVYTGSQVSAHFGGGEGDLVSRLAQAFGKSEEEVQVVFDQIHEEHQAEMEERLNQRLEEAVSNEEITKEQKQLILEKHAELQEEREAAFDAMEEMTPEERRETMQGERDELEAWADENGIDMKWLGFGRERGRMGGHMEMMGMHRYI